MIVYTEHLTSPKNPRILAWRSLKERKGRLAHGAFLVEGDRMVQEALGSGFPVEALLLRADRAKELEAAGKLLILAPDDISGMKTLNRNREAMDVLYQKGRKDAERIGAFLKGQTVSETASVG